jgi:predicted transcriptional regulator
MITLAAARHDLPTLPLKRVSKVANAIAAEVGLSPGTARRVLLAHVRALQNHHPAPNGTHPEARP